MFAIETLQSENRVVSQLLHSLADEGFVNIVNEEEEMSETTLHFALINYLYNALKLFLSDRADCFVAGNLRISYDEKNPLKWYAPDIMIAFGVENRERTSYHLATEKTMPQVIFEVASEQTADRDVGEKYLDYARLGVEEYYLLDPEKNLLPAALIAYQRDNGRLLQAKAQNNRIFSARLGLEIVNTDDGFRLFNPITNETLSTPTQLAQENELLQKRVVELEALLKNQ